MDKNEKNKRSVCEGILFMFSCVISCLVTKYHNQFESQLLGNCTVYSESRHQIGCRKVNETAIFFDWLDFMLSKFQNFYQPKLAS